MTDMMTAMIGALGAAERDNIELWGWMISPSSLARLRADVSRDSTPFSQDFKTIFGLPFIEEETWAWGWNLVSKLDAQKMRISR